MTNPTAIVPTEELLDKLWRAQLTETRNRIDSALEHGYSDDGHDYLDSSLTLSSVMTGFHYDHDLKSLGKLLNDPHNPDSGDLSSLADYACDGVAAAFYDLNCIALADD